MISRFTMSHSGYSTFMEKELCTETSKQATFWSTFQAQQSSRALAGAKSLEQIVETGWNPELMARNGVGFPQRLGRIGERREIFGHGR